MFAGARRLAACDDRPVAGAGQGNGAGGRTTAWCHAAPAGKADLPGLESFFKSFLAVRAAICSVERMHHIRRLLALLSPAKPHARQLELPLHDASRAPRGRFGKHVRLSRFAVRISRSGRR